MFSIFPPLEARSALPWYFVPSFYLFIIASVALAPGAFRTALTLPIYTYFLWKFGQHDCGGGSYGDRYALGCFFALGAMKYVDFVLLCNADREGFRPLKSASALPSTEAPKEEGGGRRVVPLCSGFSERLRWSCSIVVVYLRGYGWTHQVKNIPRAAARSKWAFVVQHALRCVGATVAIDTAKAFIVGTAAGGMYGEPLDPRGYYSESFARQMMINMCEAVMTWASFTLFTSFIYAVAAGLGIYEPEDCPPAWGSLGRMYTVRNMWGETWHQFLRRTTSMAGDCVANDVLRLRKGSFLSRYTKLFAGFFASAIIHVAGAIYGCGHDTGNFAFFMSQAVMIFVEDHVIAGLRELGFRDRRDWRVVGYCWTLAWLLYSCRWWVGPQLSEGAGVFPSPIIDLFGLIPSVDVVGGAAGNSSIPLPVPVPVPQL